MKKILILATVGGFLEQFEKHNVSLLQADGYEVHYAANLEHMNYLYSMEQLQRRHVVMHHIDIQKSPFKLRKNNKVLKEILKILQEEEIHLIHCHTPVGGLLGRLAAKRCRADGWNIKVIYTAHGFHFYQGAPLPASCLYYLVERWLARETDVLITINSEDFQRAERWKFHDGGRAVCVPGVGLDMDYFFPVSEEEKYRKRALLNVPEETCLFLSVGELNRNKNHLNVLRALNKLKKDGRDLTHIHYGICGEGSYRKKLQTYVFKHHLKETVNFFGYCENIKDYLACADFSVFPSRREGLGMAALEALSMGIPVLAADNRGTREYMKNGINGFVCSWKDVNGYKTLLQRMADLAEEELESMKTNCRNTVNRFAWSNTEEIMRHVYEGMSASESTYLHD